MSYIGVADLKNRLGPSAYLAIFDDANTGVVDETSTGPVQQICDDASARVDVHIARSFSGALPLTITPVPTSVRMAALAWARLYAIERHPEYMRTSGEAARQDAYEITKRLADTLPFLAQIDADAPSAVTATIALQPSGRVVINDVDGTYRGGDF